MSELDGNRVHITVTCEDKAAAVTFARLVEDVLRKAGFPEVRQLSGAEIQDRALGLFPVEVDRIRAMGQETYVSIATSRGRS